MDTLPLPPRPDLEQYKRRAKDLLKACRSSDPGAVRTWASEWLAALARLRGVEITPFVQHSFDRAVEQIETDVRAKLSPRGDGSGCTLIDAQRLIARAHGFTSWPRFVTHIEGITTPRAEISAFERAVDAVVGGDLPALRSLLAATPSLIRERSTREHRATLLHYIAANGVEDYRQVTPPNTVDIARTLLDAGAEVDALAETYGGGSVQTTINLLVSSTHPADAGVQPALVEALLDYGAAIDGIENDSSPLMTALAFGYPAAAETLVRRGAAVNHIITAAAIGREDLVSAWVTDDGGLRPGVRLVTPRWPSLPADARVHVEKALIWAATFGRLGVVRILLERRVDVAAADENRMTPLHCAAGAGHLEIVELLLDHGAPLEVKNVWGGTVLNSTLHFVFESPAKGVDYIPVLNALLAAGADVSVVNRYFPTGRRDVDDVLTRYGAKAADMK
jgi:ankyrin repeat protein